MAKTLNGKHHRPLRHDDDDSDAELKSIWSVRSVGGLDDRAIPTRVALDKLPPDDLKDFLIALQTIQDPNQVPITSKQSFFSLASIHWAPEDPNFKGESYCHHNTVLFPSWHRPYMAAIESALREHIPVDKRERFAFPYWDQVKGVPDILLKETLTTEIGSKSPVLNPLLGYAPPVDIQVYPDGNPQVIIPAGTLTGRGLNRLGFSKATYQRNFEAAMNNEIKGQLNTCLTAPDWYTFSTAAADTKSSTRSLESPHNSLHAYCGGFPQYDIDWEAELAKPENEDAAKRLLPIPNTFKDVTQRLTPEQLDAVRQGLRDALSWNQYNQHDKAYLWVMIHFDFVLNAVDHAMSDPEIAAFDPIFFLHHANIDRYFVAWQDRHPASATDFKSDLSKPGFKSSALRDGLADEELKTTTPLKPFPYTHKDVIDYAHTFNYRFGVLPSPVLGVVRKHSTRVHSVREVDKTTNPQRVFLLTAVNSETQKLKILSAARAFAPSISSANHCPNCRSNPTIKITLHHPIDSNEHDDEAGDDHDGEGNGAPSGLALTSAAITRRVATEGTPSTPELGAASPSISAGTSPSLEPTDPLAAKKKNAKKGRS